MTQDLLGKVKSKAAKRKEPAKGKKDDRWTIRIDGDHPNRQQLGELVELAHLSGELSPLLDQHMTEGKGILFDMWTQRMFDSKSVPDNPHIILPKLDDKGNATALDDHKCMLQVKFRTNGIQKVLPNAEDLEEGQTVEDILIDTLTSGAVGLSEKEAKRFVNEEVTVSDKMVLRHSIDAMYTGDDENQKSVATKILKFIAARSKSASGKGSVELLTDAEIDALEGGLFVTEQQVTLKDGLFERVYTYCGDLTQLRNLLRFLKVTIQVSNFDYGMSDTKQDRVERASTAATTYLVAQSDKE